MKVLLNSFHLNGRTLGFRPRTLKVQPLLWTHDQSLTLGVKGLRGPDWKYGESLARLGKSKILIIGLNDTYGELSSKIILKVSGNLYFSRKSRKTKIRVLPH